MILAIELKKKTKRLIKFRPVFSVELLRKLIKSLEIVFTKLLSYLSKDKHDLMASTMKQWNQYLLIIFELLKFPNFQDDEDDALEVKLPYWAA